FCLVPPYEIHLVIPDGPFFVEAINVESFEDLVREPLDCLVDTGIIIKHGGYHEKPQVLVQSVISRNNMRVVKEPVAMLHEQLEVPIISAFNQGGADTDLNSPLSVCHVHPCVIIKCMMGRGVVRRP